MRDYGLTDRLQAFEDSHALRRILLRVDPGVTERINWATADCGIMQIGDAEVESKGLVPLAKAWFNASADIAQKPVVQSSCPDVVSCHLSALHLARHRTRRSLPICALPPQHNDLDCQPRNQSQQQSALHCGQNRRPWVRDHGVTIGHAAECLTNSRGHQ